MAFLLPQFHCGNSIVAFKNGLTPRGAIELIAFSIASSFSWRNAKFYHLIGFSQNFFRFRHLRVGLRGSIAYTRRLDWTN